MCIMLSAGHQGRAETMTAKYQAAVPRVPCMALLGRLSNPQRLRQSVLTLLRACPLPIRVERLAGKRRLPFYASVLTCPASNLVQAVKVTIRRHVAGPASEDLLTVTITPETLTLCGLGPI